MGWGCVWSNKVGCLGVWVIIIIRGPFGYLFTQGPTLQLSESRGAGFATFPKLLIRSIFAKLNNPRTLNVILPLKMPRDLFCHFWIFRD